MRTNAANFVIKNCGNESPVRYNFVDKLLNFDGLGGVFPHVCPDKRKILHRGALLCQISHLILSMQCILSVERKTFFLDH